MTSAKPHNATVISLNSKRRIFSISIWFTHTHTHPLNEGVDHIKTFFNAFKYELFEIFVKLELWGFWMTPY